MNTKQPIAFFQMSLRKCITWSMSFYTFLFRFKPVWFSTDSTAAVVKLYQYCNAPRKRQKEYIDAWIASYNVNIHKYQILWEVKYLGIVLLEYLCMRKNRESSKTMSHWKGRICPWTINTCHSARPSGFSNFNYPRGIFINCNAVTIILLCHMYK